MGFCTQCGEGGLIEERSAQAARPGRSPRQQSSPGAGAPAGQSLNSIQVREQLRLSTGIAELDWVLGGGAVEGAAVLLGGVPGAGKSTLLIQACVNMSVQFDVLYVSAEESLQQIALRAQRLRLDSERLKLLCETQVEAILAAAMRDRPKVLIIDSIQTVMTGEGGTPGGVSQVRESAGALIRHAKDTGTVLFMVGHVTKEGALAGPRVLEHLVDCSLMLDTPGETRYRTLRAHKNRFGAANTLGIFAMTETGMRGVKNPSAIFLARSEEIVNGSAVTITWEGNRALLLELQALCDIGAGYHRLAVGTDTNRLHLLLAVLHRHCGIELAQASVYTNVVGGMRIEETGADLGLLLAVLSSLQQRPLPRDLAVYGEIGLTGEMRPVPAGQERLAEAARHGFRHAIIPKGNAPPKPLKDIQVRPVETLAEAVDAALGK